MISIYKVTRSGGTQHLLHDTESKAYLYRSTPEVCVEEFEKRSVNAFAKMTVEHIETLNATLVMQIPSGGIKQRYPELFI